MNWTKYYSPPKNLLWQGREDTPVHSAFFQIVHLHNILTDKNFEQKKLGSQNLVFGLIGFCCDEGIKRNLGRVGAAEGPQALRQALAKLPVHNQNFSFYDIGDIICIDDDLESAQQALADVVSHLLHNNIIPIVIGGGHEVAWGHYQGIVKKSPQKKLGIVNFDAHFDMRSLLSNNQGSSGTPFLQIAQDCEMHKRLFDYNCIGIQPTGNIRQLFETAKKYDVKFILAEELHQNDFQKCTGLLNALNDKNEIIYLTICLDVFAACYAPGVSAPQPLGLTPWQVIPLIRQLARSGKVVSYDIAEFCPKYDTNQQTAKLAAALIFEIIKFHV